MNQAKVRAYANYSESGKTLVGSRTITKVKVTEEKENGLHD